MKHLYLIFVASSFTLIAWAQSPNTDKSLFRQLGSELPTPNTYRTASGAPGESYWQQRADYDIKVEVDDDKQRLIGKETITYTNNSPHVLTFDGTTQTAPIQQASNGIVTNNKTIATSYTIPSTDNAMSAGPVTINSGVTVTVSSGSRW